jgi:predicted ATPase
VTTVLVGRIRERARIQQILEAARRGRSSAMVVAGEPGIGKTALLRDAVDRAQDMTVLWATGVDAEAELEHSGLLELLRPVLHLLGELPEHQADALRGALGFAATKERDRFVVAAAVLSLLAAAAELRPVFVVVDDAQWLDRASADALRFAARRMAMDRVAFVLAVRDGEAPAFDSGGFEEVRLDGMDPDAVGALLERSSGAALPADVVARVRDATNGNPLALIELGGRLTPDELMRWQFDAEPLPIAARLERAFTARLSDVAHDSRVALLIVAVATVADVDALAGALDAAGVTRPRWNPPRTSVSSRSPANGCCSDIR